MTAFRSTLGCFVIAFAAGGLFAQDRSYGRSVVATQYGWWQACQALGAPAYDPFRPEGANVNLLIPTDVIDPISGALPHRSQQCRVRKVGGPASSSVQEMRPRDDQNMP